MMDSIDTSLIALCSTIEIHFKTFMLVCHNLHNLNKQNNYQVKKTKK